MLLLSTATLPFGRVVSVWFCMVFRFPHLPMLAFARQRTSSTCNSAHVHCTARAKKLASNAAHMHRTAQETATADLQQLIHSRYALAHTQQLWLRYAKQHERINNANTQQRTCTEPLSTQRNSHSRSATAHPQQIRISSHAAALAPTCKALRKDQQRKHTFLP